MVFKSLNQIIEKALNKPSKKRIVVAGAHETHTLEAVCKAQKEGLVSAILVGDERSIKNILKDLGEEPSEYEIIEATDNPADVAVKIVHEGRADVLMKGNVQTATLIKSVLNKDYGIMKGQLLSHVLFVESPAYHKVYLVTDSAIVTDPDLFQKKAILENAVGAMNSIGCEKPKVAVLTAVENVNPKMQDTVVAAELKRLNIVGEIKNCIVEGPISTDLALDREASKIKGFDSPVAGDPDILLMPNLAAANIAVKIIRLLGKSTVAGLVLGAKVPIVLTSRSTSAKSKFMSIALSVAVADK